MGPIGLETRQRRWICESQRGVTLTETSCLAALVVLVASASLGYAGTEAKQSYCKVTWAMAGGGTDAYEPDPTLRDSDLAELKAACPLSLPNPPGKFQDDPEDGG